MRKSEAELLQEQLEEKYRDEWELTVVNLRDIGFFVPETEHPFFVVGLRKRNNEDTPPARQMLEQKSEVVIWDHHRKNWSVHRVTQWEIKRRDQQDREVYIFDTRERTFVPIDQFQLPPTAQ